MATIHSMHTSQPQSQKLFRYQYHMYPKARVDGTPIPEVVDFSEGGILGYQAPQYDVAITHTRAHTRKFVAPCDISHTRICLFVYINNKFMNKNKSFTFHP